MDELVKLIALGIASPETIVELTNGRGDENDDEPPDFIREDKPEQDDSEAEQHQ